RMNKLQTLAQNRAFIPLLGLAALPYYNQAHPDQRNYTSEEITKDGKLHCDLMEWVTHLSNSAAALTIMDLTVEHEAFLRANGLSAPISYNSPNPEIKWTLAQAKGIKTEDLTEEMIKELVIPDPYEHGRMPEFLKAVRLMSERVDKSKPKVAYVMGPFTLVAKLIGEFQTMNMMTDSDETKVVDRLLEKAQETIERYVLSLIKEGADIIVILDPSSEYALHVSIEDGKPSQFEKYIVEPANSLARVINQKGRLAIMHSCTRKMYEPAEAVLPLLAEMNVQCHSIAANVS
ncbi:unnamed protein product, partial [marine sediment metagenome]